MADYEDQNSSEYKDINQQTQAADLNPQNAGNAPQDPNPAQPDRQNPPQNDGQIPPQNSGQNPYWQNQQNGGQIPPQNPGQDPYWQNPQNGRQIPPQHPGQVRTGRISRTADKSRLRTDSPPTGRTSTITASRHTGRISLSAQGARRTLSRRSP